MVKKILIGEDNFVAQQILSTLLEGRCESLVIVSTFNELMTALGEEVFDLLLLDYRLDQTADVIIPEIKKSLAALGNPDLKIYVLSADPEEEVFRKLGDIRVEGYIGKPISKEKLNAVLAQDASAQEKSISELTHLSKLIGNDPVKQRRIVTSFLEESSLHLKKMEGLIASKDWSALGQVVHKARSGFGYVGLRSIHNKLQRWEEAIEKGMNPEAHQAVFAEIESDTLNAQKELSAFIEKTNQH